MERTALTLAPAKLVDELDVMLGDSDPAQAVIAFDGDGTLWSGDVGEDLFREALARTFLLDSALPALQAEAERYHVPLGPAEADANGVARALFAAYLVGQYPERETCAMMTWCYAGHALSAVEALATDVLQREGLRRRLQRELQPVMDWARARGVRRVLISASPRAIVEPAAAYWDISPSDVAAATPAVQGGIVAPFLAGYVPYAETKLSAGQELFGTARWLAAFGDNVFDIDMLKAAELGVAVRPKPKLQRELAALGLRLLAG